MSGQHKFTGVLIGSEQDARCFQMQLCLRSPDPEPADDAKLEVDAAPTAVSELSLKFRVMSIFSFVDDRNLQQRTSVYLAVSKETAAHISIEENVWLSVRIWRM